MNNLEKRVAKLEEHYNFLLARHESLLCGVMKLTETVGQDMGKLDKLCKGFFGVGLYDRDE